MTRPVRLQLSRGRGFRLQAGSKAENGLPARGVARPGPFANPFRVSGVITADRAVAAFRKWLDGGLDVPDLAIEREALLTRLPELAGHNLACWCRPGAPCHADVLLEFVEALEND